MFASPTLFDQLEKKATATDLAAAGQAWAGQSELIYNQEIRHGDKLPYDTFCQPIKDETISYPEKILSAPTAADIPEFSKLLSLKINLNRFICTDSSGYTTFDMERFMAQANTIAHIADDLFEIKMEGIAKAATQLRNGPAKRQREVIFLENIREQQLALRQVSIKFLHEKALLAALGLAAPYDIAFISEIKDIFTIKIAEESVAMAKSRGAFPAFTAAADINQQLTKKIQQKSPPLFDDMMKFGRRDSFIF